MFSIILIIIMILTLYYEYPKKSMNNIKEFISLKNMGKYICINILFIIVISYVPTYYLWVYIRNNDFLSLDIFQYRDVVNILGIETLLFSLIMLLYFYLPFMSKKMDNKVEKYLIIIGSLLVYFLFFLTIIISSINYYILIILFLLFLAIGIHVWVRISNIENQLKYWWMNIVSIVILLFIPYLHDNILVKQVLFNSNLGSFIVNIEDNYNENDKYRLNFDSKPFILGMKLPRLINVNEYCLLLRTNEFFYLKKDEKLFLVNTQLSKLSYPTDKVQCNYD